MAFQHRLQKAHLLDLRVVILALLVLNTLLPLCFWLFVHFLLDKHLSRLWVRASGSISSLEHFLELGILSLLLVLC